MGKKKSNPNLGQTLIKDRFGGKLNRKADSHLHTSELDDGVDWNRLNLQSVTEQNTLDEFLTKAEIAGTEFQAERLNVTIVNSERHTGLLTTEEERVVKQTQEQHRTLLRIPRRPAWTSDTTAEELDRSEKDSFLEWRRQLAELQEVEGIMMTPFERNLDFWRQLWRVIERSDVVVQIVDARNPLLFRCLDLEDYVQEVSADKINMILVNKADFLTHKQRKYWAEYFDSQDVRVAFWSAVQEAEKQQEQDQSESENGSETSESSGDESETESVENETEEIKTDKTEQEYRSSDNDQEIQQQREIQTDDSHVKNICSKSTSESSDGNLPFTSQMEKTCGCVTSQCELCEHQSPEAACTTYEGISETDKSDTCSTHDPSNYKNNASLLNGDELIELFQSLHDCTKNEKQVTTIGLVGYPNVGKSSTINALLQNKKVPVSATPGRTKHFQTLFLDPHLMLCDCPGLVMPMFVSTKAEMIISGILPVDQMRDYVPPISLITRHIPRNVLESTYGILLPRPRVEDGEDPDRLPTALELLTAYGCMRGYMTHKGVPDFHRSARNIMKDYVTGRVLYCHGPPTVSDGEFEPAAPAVKAVKLNKAAHQTLQSTQPSSIDRAFFAKTEPRVGSKGIHGVIDYTRLQDFTGHRSATEVKAKPWKKHGNRNKKEKLRRINTHLDTFT